MLVIKIPLLFNLLKQGDTIVFNHPNYGILIKKVDNIDKERRKIFVIGSHAFSVDSREFGPIGREALIGKVIWHVRKPIHEDQTGLR